MTRLQYGENKLKQLNFKVSDDLYYKLKEKSAQEHKSMNMLIIELLTAHGTPQSTDKGQGLKTKGKKINKSLKHDIMAREFV